ncbi:hypothetical protein GCM10007881_15920 [Mesorhizobium huakuii]|uniref:hypothetical protein n=1 Tax=Mesorhizobium huakuii TaxID=28104 RepID=UPI00235B9C91|nr:hypothetical protein [Mesorhizobium huakuii]GLQ78076.1 hypothetical protein GCM10007881_15920 [Mesorhizobium huakuii]
MTRAAASGHLDRAELLVHTSFIGKLDQQEQDRLVDLITLAIDRFLDGWRGFYNDESSRLYRAQEHLDRALAAVLVKEWTLHGDEFAPFTDEAGAYAWLQGEGPNADDPEPNGHFDRSNNWRVRSLWDVRCDIEAELNDLMAWDKARWKHHWSRPPSTTSRLPVSLQEMIFDFCQVWHDLVDEKLGLPRRDPNPTNPLLRFIDYCLSIALGDQRPAAKTILQLIHDHIRPEIHAADEDNRRQEEQRKTSDVEFTNVDLDPFGSD